MSDFRWKLADESDVFHLCPNHQEKEIYYARTYTVKEGYSFSETNKLISNLKKKPNSPGNQLFYKGQAIEVFATEVAALLKSSKAHFTLIPAPPSKTPRHAEFDNRLERVAEIVSAKLDNVEFVSLLKSVRDREPANSSGKTRSVDELLSSIEIDEMKVTGVRSRTVLTFLDDVATSGAQFEACRAILISRFPGHRIIGVVWAKAKEQPFPPI